MSGAERWKNAKEEDRSQNTGDRINDEVEKSNARKNATKLLITKARKLESTKKEGEGFFRDCFWV
jgi:hypothetical protein